MSNHRLTPGATDPPEASLDPDMGEATGWDLVIRPAAGWFDWRLGDFWRHRDLLWLLVWRDFVTLHKQTILGPLWHVINPLLTALTYSLIFGRVVKIPTDGLPPILFYLAGTVAWNYFTACLYKTTNALAGNAGLFGKVYFHRLIVPLSAVLSSLISFGIQCAIFALLAVFFAWRGYPVQPNSWLLVWPLLVAMLAGHGLALGLLCSALTTRYRDLGQIVGFATQLLMYATPVIYPLAYARKASYGWLMQCNPLAAIIETFRHAALGHGSAEPLWLGVSAAILLGLLLLGVTLFTRAERTFIDTV